MVTKTKRKATGAAAMGAGPGRPKGSSNKLTIDFRQTVTKLLDDNRGNFGRWLSEVAAEDPAKALDLIAKLAEYAAPKLARTEHVGDNGGAIEQRWVVELRRTDADTGAA